MPHEQLQNNSERDDVFETPEALGAHLRELGWAEDQVAGFIVAIRAMLEKMSANTIELTVKTDEGGEEMAEVTLTGEGSGLDAPQLTEIAAKEEFPLEILDNADVEFFAGENKVILRRKKDRNSDGFKSIKRNPRHN
ncbi:MAG: hypothetical protein ABR884_01770 [Minisyncoccia bacterium]|jgi:hypothetical protein